MLRRSVDRSARMGGPSVISRLVDDRVTGGDDVVHGGVKFYRGSAAAARSYVEADRSRVDDYYLAEGTGRGHEVRGHPGADELGIQRAAVAAVETLDGPTYERWVAGYDVGHRRAEGSAADRRAGSAVRRGGGQRAEDLVAGGVAPPRDRGRLRRRAGPSGGRDHRLVGRARDHPGGSAGPAGAGPGRAAGGGGGAALHLPGR